MRILNNLIASYLTWKTKRCGKYVFRQWMQLERIKEQIVVAVEKSQDSFPDRVLEYISTATGVSAKWYEQANWMRVVYLFYACIEKSPIVRLPITSSSGETKREDEPWDYDGRQWHLYSHILAKSYGWTLDYISQLQVHEAIAKIQEILTDEQLEREFIYGLSEIAYPYDQNTKKAVFKPLERPSWMKPKAKPIPRFMIPKAIMPVGNVVVDKVLSEEYLPKEPVS